jgi:hypothetical protein
VKLPRLKQSSIVFVIFCVIISMLVLAYNPASEPSYEGKSLSAWLREVPDNEDPDERAKRAENAIRAMGTNALPRLLQMLEARDSKLKERVRSVLLRQKLIRFRFSPSARFQRAMACRGLRVLGPTAAPAIQSIEENLFSHDADMSLPGVLISIGNAAWPIFVRAMTNQNPELRGAAIMALWKATNRLDEATPALMEIMRNDTLMPLRLYAALTLAKTGKHEDSIVPLLVDGLKSGNDTGAEVARALGNYPSKAREHIDALIKIAEGPDIIAHFGAMDALRKIDPAAAEAAEKKRQPQR